MRAFIGIRVNAENRSIDHSKNNADEKDEQRKPPILRASRPPRKIEVFRKARLGCFEETHVYVLPKKDKGAIATGIPQRCR